MRFSAAPRALILAAIAVSGSLAYAQTEVRFGVFGLFHPNTLTLQAVGDGVVSVQGSNKTFVLSTPERRQIVLRADGDRVLAQGRPARQWAATARDGSRVRFQLSVPAKIHRIYEGKLIVTAHHGELIPVVTMDVETAVVSIVAAEMPVGAPVEALKAQAVATRSFLASGSRHTEFDFCDTTHCQYLRSPEDASARVTEAVRATRGMILAYQQQPLPAMYASRCGGQTHTLQQLGMNSGSGYPYYAVRCDWCRQHPVRWQTRIENNGDIPRAGNEPARIAQARQWGWSALPGNTFTVKKEEHGLLITVQNVGHGVGLCQFGAIGMAAAGADYQSILAHYYPNTELIRQP